MRALAISTFGVGTQGGGSTTGGGGSGDNGFKIPVVIISMSCVGPGEAGF